MLRPTAHPSPSANQPSPAANPGSPAPTSQDVLLMLGRLQKRHPGEVTLITLGHTAEHRPMVAARLRSSAGVAAKQKARALIVAGQHGNEESARAVALGLMKALLSPAHQHLLGWQDVLIIPDLSPDAAARNSYETPAGIKPNLDHGPRGPVSPEANALQSASREFMPDLFVDVHARGQAGCSYDMVLFPPARPYTEDEGVLWRTARLAADAGQRYGIPHVVHPLTWPGWGGPGLDHPSSTLWHYRTFKSLVLLTETCESDTFAYPMALRVRTGVARLLAVLAIAGERHTSLPKRGYPVDLITGTFTRGIIAHAPTAEQRRQCRSSLWREADHLNLKAEIPEHPDRRVVTFEYDGATLYCSYAVLMRFAGRRRVQRVLVNGRAIPRDRHRGWHAYRDGACTCVTAAMPMVRHGKEVFTFILEPR